MEKVYLKRNMNFVYIKERISIYSILVFAVFLLATSLSCEDADALIERIRKNMDGQAEIEMVEVVKSSTSSECYEGSESSG